jgi:Fe-Mn family superoxide dismutase
MMTRREAIRTTLLTSAACTTLLGTASTTTHAQPAAPTGPFTLPPLPYAHDALEPHIDAMTMQIHHGKHHAAYVTNLNKALTGTPELAKQTIEQLVRNLAALPDNVRTAVRNSGGGHYNHLLFWQMMKKGGGEAPSGDLAKAIDRKFGSFDSFKQQFTDAATKVFGSGWAWLTLDGQELRIESTPNQDSPLTQGRKPLLGLDVWEHAYYLKYQNRRLEYIAAFYNVINWDFVADRFGGRAA